MKESEYGKEPNRKNGLKKIAEVILAGGALFLVTNSLGEKMGTKVESVPAGGIEIANTQYYQLTYNQEQRINGVTTLVQSTNNSGQLNILLPQKSSQAFIPQLYLQNPNYFVDLYNSKNELYRLNNAVLYLNQNNIEVEIPIYKNNQRFITHVEESGLNVLITVGNSSKEIKIDPLS
jgi:hypothetical protein